MKSLNRISLIGAILLASACGEDASDAGNENEVLTTVTLTFTPTAGGAPVVALFNDADGDLGNPPVIDPVRLAPGMYNLGLKFENRLEMPAEDITLEILDEANDHQVFFTGSAVNSPASVQASAPLTQVYSDTDANRLVLGLTNGITAVAGTGTLTVTLRHMPPVNGMPVKTAAAADTVRTSGFAGLGGSTDVSIDFAVTVM